MKCIRNGGVKYRIINHHYRTVGICLLSDLLLNQCRFHIHNPLSTTTGRKTKRTALAAAGMVDTGP